MNWLKSMFAKSEKRAPDVADEFEHHANEIKSAGVLDGGGHYTDYVERVKELKREGKNQEAIDLLTRCVDATEAESKKVGSSTSIGDDKYSWLNEVRN